MKPKTTTIRSSKTSLKFSNIHRLHNLSLFIDEYQRVTQTFVNILWDMPKVHRLIEKDITDQVKTWISKRAMQCSAKQASGIVRGTRKKQEQRLYKYQEFLNQGMFCKARKLKKTIDEQTMSKPNIKKLQVELDSRFIQFDMDNGTSFNWIVLSSLGNKLKIKLPFKTTKHFNMLSSRGIVKKGVRLSKDMVTFMFEIPVVNPVKGDTLGLDIGMKNVYSTSDSQQSTNDKHGWDLVKIQERLSRRKKGSQGFQKSQEHRKNYINWSINQLNLQNIGTIRIERIKRLRKGHKSSRMLSHWAYTIIFDKLGRVSEDTGVQILRTNSTYTSQRCSQCGWTRKSNRKGKLFKCTSCSFTDDADLNASRNIALVLPAISRQRRQQHLNRKGFYWGVVGQEAIVPDVQAGNIFL